MAIHLTVRHPFADYVIGERITDPEKIKEALEHNARHVTKIAAEDSEQSVGEPPETA